MSANEIKEIKIVGHGDKIFPYTTEIKKSVVKIKDLFYRRDDPQIVKVMVGDKIRYFREKSPLIVKLPNGKFMYKPACIKTEDGVYLDPQSDDVIRIDDKYYRKAFCVPINGRWYLQTDPLLVRLDNGKLCLKSEASLLCAELYGENRYVLKSNIVQDTHGNSIRAGDSVTCYNPATDKLDTYHARDGIFNNTGVSKRVVYDFQDVTNPQYDRVVLRDVLGIHDKPEYLTTVTIAELGVVWTVSKLKEKYFLDAINNFIMPRLILEAEKMRIAINKNFSDLDKDENTAKLFKIIGAPWPGKKEIYKPRSHRDPVAGKTFKLTGGLKYSFGVEFETSQGLVPSKLLEEVGLFAVGDRSIGAAEYVTPPMQGDLGIKRLQAMCRILNQHTLVDNRCGLHVHVGTLNPESENSKERPSFSKEFLINSIKLGAYLEEELFQSLPPNRIPTLYHCHSIRRFAPISKTNFDTYLGAFIFGPKEKWLNESGKPIPPFNMEDYRLGANRNHNSELGVWAEGRYKWLNLIHSYTRARHQTIEFRIFSATTVYEKAYAFLLTSLAFTYVADNKPSIIKKGITLSQVFDAAFSTNKEIIAFLNAFYEERKAKFNRKNIYPVLDFLK